jgi:hypothetical protein
MLYVQIFLTARGLVTLMFCFGHVKQIGYYYYYNRCQHVLVACIEFKQQNDYTRFCCGRLYGFITALQQHQAIGAIPACFMALQRNKVMNENQKIYAAF